MSRLRDLFFGRMPFLFIALAGALACGSDSIPTLVQDFPSPAAAFLGPIGCEASTSSAGNSVVTVPQPTGGLLYFDCADVERSSVQAAARAYLEQFTPTVAKQTANGDGDGYVNVRIYFQCEVTLHWQYAAAMGEWVYTYYDTDGCWVTAIEVLGGGSPGGGWSGGSGTDPNTEREFCEAYYKTRAGNMTENNKCLVPLNESDWDLLNSVMDTSATGELLPLSMISDPGVRDSCAILYQDWSLSRSDQSIQGGRIWKGKYSDYSQGVPTHNAQVAGQKMHFDPHMFQDVSGTGRSNLARNALHEARHLQLSLMGVQSPHTSASPYTNEPWFGMIHRTSGPSCFR